MNRIVLLSIVTAVMYSIQGSIMSLAESTLPQLLNRNETSLEVNSVLAIVKLPAALKIFLAPFVDYMSHRLPKGYATLLICMQAVACASLCYLALMVNVASSTGGVAAASQLRWPLFSCALFNAASDLVLDAFALIQFPEQLGDMPALCQVVGIFVGKVIGKSGFFALLNHGWLSLSGFVTILAVETGICVFGVLAVTMQGVHPATTDGTPNELHIVSVMTRTWEFSTHRRNMPHWLAYQFLMPAMYFHVVSVLGNRYEQLGFNGEDYALYELPIALVTLVALVMLSRLGADNKRPLALPMRFYVVEAALIAGLLAQYRMWSGAATRQFTLIYVLMTKVQELLFFLFEATEFAFYGRIARLDQQLVATVMTLQTSAFNFGEFFHCWFAPKLVDMLSVCTSSEAGTLECAHDAYPSVACTLTLVSITFLVTQWGRIDAYQSLQDQGWLPQNARATDQLFVIAVFAGIGVFTVCQLLP
jgi:hypothetical protein